MGGLVALTYAESDRPQPDLLVLSSPWLADFQPGWRRAVARVGGRLLPTLSVANGFDGSTLSRDPRSAPPTWPTRWPTTRRRSGWDASSCRPSAGAGADLDRLRVPAFVTHGSADPLVPTASSEVLATLPNVERKVYPGLRHETLNEPEGPGVAADMAVWIGAHLGSSSPRA